MNQASETAQLLLEMVAAEHQRRRTALLQEAGSRAAELKAQARLQARARLRAAFEEAREAADQGLRKLEAQLATARRMQHQRAESALIDRVQAALPAAFEACWNTADARGRWIERVLQQALGSLPAGKWSVIHPSGLPQPELVAIRERLTAALGPEPELQADGAISMGLRVRAGNNVLDGTPAGMLADRASIDARVLALAGVAGGE